MPVNKIYERWHFHQRMNQKVAHNVEKLIDLYSTAKSKQAILDGLHPWRVSTNLRYNNLFSYFLLLCCAGRGIIFTSFSIWAISLILFAFCMLLFGYSVYTPSTELNALFDELNNYCLENKYNFKFC